MDDLISTKEAAAILGVTPRAVRWYYLHRGLAGRMIGSQLVFLRADVETFVKPKITGRPPKKRSKKKGSRKDGL